MLELHVLGSVDLRTTSGAEHTAVLHQPKRLGLLIYLALARPRRFHRRDSLLATFWPDLDESHARAALRRSLYFLRQHLGNELIVSRGEEEVGLAQGALWCDAIAFEERVAAGDLSAALEVFRGELLPGFYVAGAPAIERWLEEERVGLRERAADSAWSLAASAGAPGEAARWARRAASFTPDDEQALGRLLALLDRQGLRDEALHAYDAYARRLASEEPPGPGPDLVRLAEGIRARPPAAAAAPSPDSTRVVVSPFAVHGTGDHGYLAEGMVQLLSTALEGADGFTAVDPRALLQYQGRSGGGPVGGEALARHFNAAFHLAGSVVSAGGRILVAAVLHAATGDVVARAETRQGTESDLFELVDDLVRQLLAGRSRRPVERLARLAALTTTSLPALKAWLAGERAFRLGKYFEAIDAFRHAGDLDESFALAHYRLASVLAASALIVPAREATDRAWRHRERLSERDRLLLEAQRAWLWGRSAEAERSYGSLVAIHPGDAEAWFLLGDVIYHRRPFQGGSSTEARGAFERALELDPAQLPSLLHLVRIDALEGQVARLDDRIARAVQLSPDGDQAFGMRALRAWALGRVAEQEELLALLPAARAHPAGIALANIALYAHDLAGAERFAIGFLAAARAPELKALVHAFSAHILLGRGRRHDARQQMAAAARHEAAHALEIQGLIMATTLPAFPLAEVAAVRDQLASWDPRSAARLAPPFDVHEAIHPHLRLYLLGALGAALGDPAETARRAEELAELPVPEGTEVLLERLGRTLEALIHRAQGRPAEALRRLEGARSDVWFQLAVGSPFYAGAHERFLRAELLCEAGRQREAIGWYRSIAEFSLYELPFLAPARLRLAAIHTNLGERARAARCYDEFIRLWQEPDPELRPMIDEARRRKESLRVE
jgi:DNA-binding SARP family transcriptional activator